MENRFVQRNVDLLSLADYLMAFFDRMGLEAEKKKINEGFKILVRPSRGRDMHESVTVHVLGKPDDFIINFVTGDLSRSLIRWGSLTTLLGGGNLLLRGLKSKDFLETLEKDFWKYVYEKMDSLSRLGMSR